MLLLFTTCLLYLIFRLYKKLGHQLWGLELILFSAHDKAIVLPGYIICSVFDVFCLIIHIQSSYTNNNMGYFKLSLVDDLLLIYVVIPESGRALWLWPIKTVQYCTFKPSPFPLISRARLHWGPRRGAFTAGKRARSKPPLIAVTLSSPPPFVSVSIDFLTFYINHPLA